MKRTYLVLIIALAFGINCSFINGPDDPPDGAAMALALLAVAESSDDSSSDSSGTSGGCAGGSLSSATSITSGNSAAGNLSSSSEVDVFSLSVNTTSKYLIFLHTVDSGLDVTMTICNSSEVTQATYNNNGAGSPEGITGGTFTAFSTFYISVTGTAAGAYRLDIEDDNFGLGASVSGGGSCTTWNAGLAGECLNFDADFQDPQTYCETDLTTGTYSTGVCSATNLQGRCTGYLGGTNGAGYMSVLGYTGDFASDGDMQTWCDAALGSGQYLYNSSNI